MKKTLNSFEVVDALLTDEFANWSLDGARAFIEWHEQLEEDIGEELEFDTVAMRCDWSEDSPHNIWEDLGDSWADSKKKNIFDESTFEQWLGDNTVFIKLDNGNILFQIF